MRNTFYSRHDHVDLEILPVVDPWFPKKVWQKDGSFSKRERYFVVFTCLPSIFLNFRFLPVFQFKDVIRLICFDIVKSHWVHFNSMVNTCTKNPGKCPTHDINWGPFQFIMIIRHVPVYSGYSTYKCRPVCSLLWLFSYLELGLRVLYFC